MSLCILQPFRYFEPAEIHALEDRSDVVVFGFLFATAPASILNSLEAVYANVEGAHEVRARKMSG